MARKVGLISKLGPRGAAEFVANRYAEERNMHLPEWTAKYEQRVSQADLGSFVEKLTDWYSVLMPHAGEIAATFSKIKQEYLRRKRAIRPVRVAAV